MNQLVEKEKQFRLLSLLLLYPDEKFLSKTDEIREISDRFFGKEPGEKLEAFLEYLESHRLLELQEIYSATFDLTPVTCLNLTYHRWGDGKERGSALARFREVYADSGFIQETGELPDYLPMVLEFLSFCSGQWHADIKKEYGESVKTIRERLKKQDNPYAGLFEIVTDLFKKCEPGIQ